MIIGITGKSGSGKNYFGEHLDRLSGYGCEHIDIDTVGHEVIKIVEVKNQLIECFGNIILNKNNEIDRRQLGELIFNNRHKYKLLSDITWKYMEKIIDTKLSSLYKGQYCIINWILLPHTKYFDMCDIKYLIKSNEDQRKRDVMKRDNITEKQLELRDKNSIIYNEDDFDFIVYNNRR